MCYQRDRQNVVISKDVKILKFTHVDLPEIKATTTEQISDSADVCNFPAIALVKSPLIPTTSDSSTLLATYETSPPSLQLQWDVHNPTILSGEPPTLPQDDVAPQPLANPPLHCSARVRRPPPHLKNFTALYESDVPPAVIPSDDDDLQYENVAHDPS